MANSPWLTLARYLYGMTIGATIVEILFTNHDFTLWRVGLAALVVLLGAVVHTILELAVQKAGE
jgi:hypothetical protein